MKAEVANLRGQWAKNSRNSSLPSSAEGLKKTKSMRKKGSRPPGGRSGHSGSTLKQVAHPDRVVDHPLPGARIADAVARAEVAGAVV